MLPGPTENTTRSHINHQKERLRARHIQGDWPDKCISDHKIIWGEIDLSRYAQETCEPKPSHHQKLIDASQFNYKKYNYELLQALYENPVITKYQNKILEILSEIQNDNEDTDSPSVAQKTIT